MADVFCPLSEDYRGERAESMQEVKIHDEYIKLGQAMKLAGIVGSGVDAKMVIQDGLVTVNGKVETQRGKKLHDGDVVSFEEESFQIRQ